MTANWIISDRTGSVTAWSMAASDPSTSNFNLHRWTFGTSLSSQVVISKRLNRTCMWKWCTNLWGTAYRLVWFFSIILALVGRDSSVGIDSLRAGRSGNRIPVGARFSAPVQNGPGAYSASYIMGTGSFQGVKRPRRWPPTPSSAEVKERVTLYLCSPYGPSWPVLGWILPFTFSFTLALVNCIPFDGNQTHSEGVEREPVGILIRGILPGGELTECKTGFASVFGGHLFLYVS